MGKKIDESIILKAKDMYVNEHISCEQIAKKLGIGASTVVRNLRKIGVEVASHPHAGKFNIDDAIKLYTQDKIPIHKIAEIFKSTEKTISKVLKENNIEVTRVLKFNEHVFDIIDSEEKAYWLGFLWADGCVVSVNPEKPNYAIELDLSSKDRNHLVKFCHFLSLSEDRIKEKICPPGKLVKKERKVSRVQISSKHMWKTLVSYGMVPRKTYDERFPYDNTFENPDLIRHFIRGYFDGDGCLTWHDKEHTHPEVSIIGLEDFLLKLISYLPKELHKPIYKSKNSILYETNWAYNKAFIFLNFIYNNSNIVLDRKFNIYSSLLLKKSNAQSGNIGESPFEDNPEINSEIKKSESSYSIGLEPLN